MKPEINEVNSEGIAFVIFGVTGDLTRRKLIPALYELLLSKRLKAPIYIVGFARRDWTDEYLRQVLREGLEASGCRQPIDEEAAAKLLEGAHYVRSTFDDPAGYQALSRLLNGLPISDVLLYLATPPESYIEIIQQIGEVKLQSRPSGWTRIVIEKPYGNDLHSAEALEEEVHRVFQEEQVYRIDHYLGKETVQNILVLRFANGIFEPLWGRRYVDHVQITVSETNGVGTRGGYYEGSGVIRDMFQNHLLQLLTLTAMEAPGTISADAVRDEKVKGAESTAPDERRGRHREYISRSICLRLH